MKLSRYMSVYRKSLFIKLCVIFVCVFLAGGSCASKPKCLPPPSLADSDSMPPATANLSTDVFLDATISMQGFISDNSLSYYQQSIPMLERAIIKNGGRAAFYKFGTDIKELSGRSYGDADKKNFYTDSLINKKTLIEKVIERADSNHLTVIITDLFQEKSDINQLSEKIKTKFNF